MLFLTTSTSSRWDLRKKAFHLLTGRVISWFNSPKLALRAAALAFASLTFLFQFKYSCHLKVCSPHEQNLALWELRTASAAVSTPKILEVCWINRGYHQDLECPNAFFLFMFPLLPPFFSLLFFFSCLVKIKTKERLLSDQEIVLLWSLNLLFLGWSVKIVFTYLIPLIRADFLFLVCRNILRFQGLQLAWTLFSDRSEAIFPSRWKCPCNSNNITTPPRIRASGKNVTCDVWVRYTSWVRTLLKTKTWYLSGTEFRTVPHWLSWISQLSKKENWVIRQEVHC